MTPTATKTRPKADTLSKYLALEEAWGAAEAETKRLSRGHADRFRQAQALLGERGRLAHRHPELVDHQGQPAEKGNAIAQIDEQVQALGDLSDSNAKVEHASRIVAKAKEEAITFSAAHFREIVAGFQPEAEMIRAEAHEWADAGVAIAQRYHGLAQRIAGLREGNRALYGMRIAGIDEGADFLRAAESLAERELPLPTDLP